MTKSVHKVQQSRREQLVESGEFQFDFSNSYDEVTKIEEFITMEELIYGRQKKD